ncbi:cobalamin biosynthesis protein cbig [hydrocarbon metagenome]|uniref:Cobalamin biosynthesis protein cbig n=1 Tax=hydrocarbon metagenome TaxID=938273 RepID=A0A0W8EA12_9ZZZZ
MSILCLTSKGAELAVRIGKDMEGCRLYIPMRLKCSCSIKSVTYFKDWQETFREAFENSSQLICIMATGIVVRSLASLLVSKVSDPAVVVMDEDGSYVISLLSGHIGGANRLAQEIALKTGGRAVITTATDVAKKRAVDLLAMEIDAVLEPFSSLKHINRALAEDGEVNIYSPWPLIPGIKEGFTWQEWPELDEQGAEFLQPAVIISWKQYNLKNLELIQLRPRNLVVGIGCRKGVSLAELEKAINEVIHGYSLDRNCVKCLATIDLKAEEKAIKDLAEKDKVPLITFSKKEIAALDGTFEPSVWVQDKIGVGGVCEPAARLGANLGITLVPKQKIGPVSISVAMERSWWWDWDRVKEIS